MQAADAVIHAASDDGPASVLTLIGALERSSKPLKYTTRSGIVADWAGGEYASPVVFNEDTYFEPVPFRRPRVELIHFVRQAGISKGIRTIVICPTMVYGVGRGMPPDSDPQAQFTLRVILLVVLGHPGRGRERGQLFDVELLQKIKAEQVGGRFERNRLIK